MKEKNTRSCPTFPRRLYRFRRYKSFRNVLYKMVHTNETTALLRSWKKTLTTIRLSVSKLYVTLCGAAGNLRASVTVCWGY